uniref:Uncharacterized protein n=1 Tax=Siphoviridae sp. ct6YY1 TaxID=2825343 RepID=A0A8S5V303_9CAUD|nr:MAG TPA: hypothetical protein [Siphoviridae sp. ct6YY1]
MRSWGVAPQWSFVSTFPLAPVVGVKEKVFVYSALPFMSAPFVPSHHTGRGSCITAC